MADKTVSTVQPNGTEPSKKKIIAAKRDDFMRRAKPRNVPVHCVELDDPAKPDEEFWVRVRGMNAGEQDQVSSWSTQRVNIDERTLETRSNAEQTRAKVLSWCVLDYETEQPIWTPGDIFDIQDYSAALVSRLNAVVINQSQVTAEEVERIVKAFPTTRESSYSTN